MSCLTDRLAEVIDKITATTVGACEACGWNQANTVLSSSETGARIAHVCSSCWDRAKDKACKLKK